MKAEYDFDNNVVVAIETDEGRIAATNNPRTLGAPTEWLPVDHRLPIGYDSRFNSLLRAAMVRYTYNEQTRRVVVDYPEADFSPSAIREELRKMSRGSARQILAQTDWYLIRKVETGEPVPEEVVETRQRIRDKVDAHDALINQTADADLNQVEIEFFSDPIVSSKNYGVPEPTPPGGDGREWVTDATAPGQKGEPLYPAEEGE